MAFGFAAGDRILIRLPHSFEYAFAFFAANLAGLVPVPERFSPTADAAAYARSYAEYRKLFGSLKGMYHRLNRGR